MRKHIILAITILASLSLSAQTVPTHFFGQTVGKPVVLSELSPDSGWTSENTEVLGDVYSLKKHEYAGLEWDYVSICVNRQGIVYSILFSMEENYTESYSDIINTPVFKKVLDKSLIIHPSLTYVKLDEGSTYNTLDEEGHMISVNGNFKPTETGGFVATASLAYTDMTAFFTMVNDTIEEECPEIQDTFFGIKIGTRTNLSAIKQAVGSRGTFLDTKNPYTTPSHVFSDVYFGGSKWNYCTFQMTNSGQLYEFQVYDSLSDYGYDKEYAFEEYETMKKRLFNKYGEVEEEKDDNGVHIQIVGKGGMRIWLSRSRERSQGGAYRQFVKLDYYNIDLLREANNTQNDEL